MKYQQVLSIEEIAEITGKSVSAVKMRVYRGPERLEKVIKITCDYFSPVLV